MPVPHRYPVSHQGIPAQGRSMRCSSSLPAARFSSLAAGHAMTLIYLFMNYLLSWLIHTQTHRLWTFRAADQPKCVSVARGRRLECLRWDLHMWTPHTQHQGWELITWLQEVWGHCPTRALLTEGLWRSLLQNLQPGRGSFHYIHPCFYTEPTLHVYCQKLHCFIRP